MACTPWLRSATWCVIVDVLSFTTCVDIDHSSRLDCSASAPLLQDESYVDRNFSP